MPVTFDFVSGDDFRASLESDYRELEASVASSSWKAAHVLAGSIVEAILIDYLVAIKYGGKTEESIMKMSLEEAIAACEKENFLSSRAADLSTVVRGYRNLIHPGRVIRLVETVDENSAKVAQALVDMIVKEVASRKEQAFGYTAEQIVTKIQQDTSVRPILPHLLKETRGSELDRLLTDVLPHRYYEAVIASNNDIDHRVLDNMVLCFHQGFDQSTDSLKQKVARRFVTIVKEETGEFVSAYEAAFFTGRHLEYVPPADQVIAVRHVIARLAEDTDLSFASIFRMMKGIGRYLSVANARTLTAAVIREYTQFAVDDSDKLRFRNVLKEEYRGMSAAAQKAALQYLEARMNLFESNGMDDSASQVLTLKSYLDDTYLDDIPF